MGEPNKDEKPVTEELRKTILYEEQMKNLTKPIFNRKNLPVFGSMAVAIILLLEYLSWDQISRNPMTAIFPVLGVTVYFVFLFLFILLVRWIARARLEQTHKVSLTRRAEELQDKLDENFFTNLVKINFTHIDKYYSQTQIQANKSFVLSTIAAFFSFFVILIGIVMMFFGKNNPSYVTTAAGVLGEFISAVFFYLYNRTIIKMGEYHQKLVLTQNISLALKITEELPEADRAKSREKLIEYLSKDINVYLTKKVE